MKEPKKKLYFGKCTVLKLNDLYNITGGHRDDGGTNTDIGIGKSSVRCARGENDFIG